MRFIEVNKHFWILEAIKLLCCLNSLFNEKQFHLEVSENKVVIFFPSKLTDPLKSGPQATNSCPKQRKWCDEALKYVQLMSLHHSICLCA